MNRLLSSVLAMLLIIAGVVTSHAELTLNSVSASPSGYVAGETTSISVEVDFSSMDFESADYLVFTLPAGATIALDPSQVNPLGGTNCGPVIVSGEGTNALSLGINDPGGMPTGGSSCGVFEPGVFTFYFNLTAPMSFAGDQDLVVDIYGDGFSGNPTPFLSSTIVLSQVFCLITCPSDIVISADPGMCGATVVIPLPTVSGMCTPDPVDQSGFYPVGTTEVIFGADASGAGGEITCTILVTVVDSEAPTVSAPADQTISLGGGACDQIVNFLLQPDDACANPAVELTQSVDNMIVNTSFACPGGSSSYYRVFDLAALGYNTDINISSVDFGVFQAFNAPNVTVSIFELSGTLSLANLTLVSENTMSLPNLLFEVYNFPIVATLEANRTYVVKIETPGSTFNGFVMGANSAGETAPTYISSNFCGFPEITSIEEVGGFNQHAVMTLNGEQDAFTIEQTEGLEAGSPFPIGVTTNTFVITDVAGNTNEVSFDITVNEFANPITTLACNNLVNVSLDANCEGLITPDMVLEGGPYGCYDNYTITIKDEDGNEYGNVVTGNLVGEQLIVEVEDPSGNICWGDIFIEDKVGPQLECGTLTTQCTNSTDPSSPLPSSIRITLDPDEAISIQNPSTIDIPIEVEGLKNALISDLNVDIDISHSWVSDLGIVLVSPEGTEISLAVQPGFAVDCAGNNIQVTFDDEATLTNNDLDFACSDDDPAISGDYQPAMPLSAFDFEDPNGTWILRVSDFAFGDGGVVRSVTLEIGQTNGSIGLPLPPTASAIPLTDNSFFVFGLDPCGPAVLSYEDEVINMDCTSPYTQVIYRTYTATDESGNSAISCMDTINVLRTDLATLEIPRNYDDLDLPSLNCSSGYPTPNVTGVPSGDFCDNVEMDYEDITIDICEGSYKILRYWRVFEWCESEVVEFTQIIKVIDQEGPQIQCPVLNDVLSTSPSSCTAGLLLPIPVITDNCTAVPTFTVSTDAGVLLQQGSNYTLSGLEIGTATVTYTAFDNCGNSNTCTLDIVVEDQVSPIAVCDQHTTVSLSFDDLVSVNALTFDDGSYDECSDITMTARRMSDECGFSGNTQFSSSVVFCCADVGTTVMVAFRVEDASGNFNTCMVEVEVDDKIAPAIQVPSNVTLNCQDDYTDLNLTGGIALGFDNCGIDTVFYQDFPSIGSCGSGQVSRVFTVVDRSGLTASGTQIIFLEDNDPFDINDIDFPNDAILTNCEASTDPSNTGEPMISDDICSQVSYTFWDDTFVIVEDACLQIFRKWTVIDQCQYNSNTGQGIWEDIQVIEIINNTDPNIISGCSGGTYDVFGNCEGEVTLAIEAEDDCTPEDKLAYTWKIDLFNANDNVFELQGTGKTLTSTFTVGTHRIVWTVSDKCGNTETCSYLFTVQDGKAPTPYCITTLSTAVMNTNGEVTIWASDFDLGATDNCTPGELLVPSFTENGITNSLTFSCADIPNGIAALIEGIQVWVTDEAGNKDFCTVQLLLEDNEASFCDDVGTITATGALKTSENEIIKNVDLQASNLLGDVLQGLTNDNGLYAFDLIPNFNYEITADKIDDNINGITTLDIVLIQKHILGLELFESPYQTIAADTDNSSSISGADIIAIRRLILGYTDLYPNDQLAWRFVDATQQFNNVYEVFPYDEVVDISFSSGSVLSNDFYGVKIGDVNMSANPASFSGNTDTRSGQALDLVITNQEYNAGEIIEIPVYAENFQDMIAYQMTMEYDVNLIEIVNVKAGVLGMEDELFNMTRLSEGLFSTAWYENEAMSTDEVLFTMVAKAKRSGNLKNVFRVSDRITETLAYDEDQEAHNIEIQTRDGAGNVIENEVFVIYQNQPNPFAETTNIQFDLPMNSQVELNVFNTNGSLIFSRNEVHAAGYNTIKVNREDLGASGVYYYSITVGDKRSSVQKMILID